MLWRYSHTACSNLTVLCHRRLKILSANWLSILVRSQFNNAMKQVLVCYISCGNHPFFFKPLPNEVGGAVYWIHLFCPSIHPSVSIWHGFRSISQVCFGVSISNFITCGECINHALLYVYQLGMIYDLCVESSKILCFQIWLGIYRPSFNELWKLFNVFRKCQ